MTPHDVGPHALRPPPRPSPTRPAQPGAGLALAAGRWARGGESLALLAVLVLVVGLHAALLRPGHGWSDDFAMYLAHAQNLATGRPYGDTGYSANPWAVPGPGTYPPVYPLLITPLVAAWGLDLQALKLLDLLLFGGALAAGHALLRPRVGAPVALAGVLLLGLCPFLIGFFDEVRPDALFLLLFLLTLVLGERWTGQPPPPGLSRQRQLGQGLALGLVAYLAYGTRSVGKVRLPALLVVQLWRQRRVGPVLSVALPLWLALAAAQALTLHSDRAYASLLTLDPHTLAYNSYSYLASLSLLWQNSLPAPWGLALRGLMFVLVSALALVGYAQALRRGISVLEVVALFYLAPLLLYWVGTMIQQRYMLPLFPIYLYHAWRGLGVLGRRWGGASRRALLALLAAGAAVGQLSACAALPHGEIRPGVTDAPGLAVLAAVREQLPADATLLVGRARAFALYGQRRTVSPYGYRSDEQLWQLIGQHRISHIVVGRGALAKEMDYEHPQDLARFVAAQGGRLRPVFANSDFEIHAVLAAAGDGRTP